MVRRRFAECLDRVAELVGFVPAEPVWTRPADGVADHGDGALVSRR